MLGQLSSQSSGLLSSQVLWLVLLTGVEGSDRVSLVQVDDGQNTGNVLSDGTDLWQRWLGELLNLQVGKLLLQGDKLLLQLILGLGTQFVSSQTGLVDVSIVIKMIVVGDIDMPCGCCSA